MFPLAGEALSLRQPAQFKGDALVVGHRIEYEPDPEKEDGRHLQGGVQDGQRHVEDEAELDPVPEHRHRGQQPARGKEAGQNGEEKKQTYQSDAWRDAEDIVVNSAKNFIYDNALISPPISAR